MAALPMVLINHADIKSAVGVALHVRTQAGLRPRHLTSCGTHDPVKHATTAAVRSRIGGRTEQASNQGRKELQFWHLGTLAILLLSGGASEGATIERQPGPGGQFDLIVLNGPIKDGDDARFRDIAASAGKAVVLLNSEGGSVAPALEMGRTIRLKGLSTSVPPDTLCASACALIWLAGSPRFLNETSHIGFHASYTLTEGKPSESGVSNALVGAYLNQIGLPEL